jgi:hypothetical protein
LKEQKVRGQKKMSIIIIMYRLSSTFRPFFLQQQQKRFLNMAFSPSEFKPFQVNKIKN